jgi:hypothetical protein
MHKCESRALSLPILEGQGLPENPQKKLRKRNK